MPEGDTIYQAASALGRALNGKRVDRFEVPRLSRATERPAPGATITAVEARGKHLIIHFGDGFALHTHLALSGSWHLYRAGERWQRPARQVRARIDTDDGTVAVCFNAPTVEVLRERNGELRHDRLDALGPDLCRADADIDEALRRMRTIDPHREIGVVLLDQRVACGVGNVYKSEVLFASRVDPFTTVADLGEPARRLLLDTASRQLQANLGGGRRATMPGGGLAVYAKTGRPCPRCGTPIKARRQGDHARTTYWCPGCQPPQN